MADKLYIYETDVAGSRLPVMARHPDMFTTSGAYPRANPIMTSTVLETAIMQGQSWATNDFEDAGRWLGNPHFHDVLTPYIENTVYPDRDGPIKQSAGIALGGTILDLTGNWTRNRNTYNANNLNASLAVAVTQQRLRARAGMRITPILHFTAGYPASTWQSGGGGGLKPGGTSWTNMLSIDATLQTLVPKYYGFSDGALSPLEYVVRRVLWLQGGDSARTLSENITDLTDWTDENDAVGFPGTGTTPLQFYLAQVGGTTSATTAVVGKEAQLDFYRSNVNGRTTMVGPWYWAPLGIATVGDDGSIHFTGLGTLRVGEMFGYAVHVVEDLGLAFQPLDLDTTTGLSRSGQNIIVSLVGPWDLPDFKYAPLEFDTTSVTAKTANGFVVKRSGIDLTITATTIDQTNKTVTLTISETLNAADVLEVSYAWYGTAMAFETYSATRGNLKLKGPRSVFSDISPGGAGIESGYPSTYPDPRDWTIDAWMLAWKEEITL